MYYVLEVFPVISNFFVFLILEPLYKNKQYFRFFLHFLTFSCSFSYHACTVVFGNYFQSDECDFYRTIDIIGGHLLIIDLLLSVSYINKINLVVGNLLYGINIVILLCIIRTFGLTIILPITIITICSLTIIVTHLYINKNSFNNNNNREKMTITPPLYLLFNDESNERKNRTDDKESKDGNEYNSNLIIEIPLFNKFKIISSNEKNKKDFINGIILIVIGISCLMIPPIFYNFNIDIYWIFHSFWHCIIYKGVKLITFIE
eukprot:TRINITY_DN9360_c0_g2_i1.p1 TRINITY_DN9360_c0_g2~~TRINITY_DN9360_c0_g2_i1.p1  ORF type:complete len:261 (-),score=-7.05 TRINITY_DN9360_c0_g2_i1:43-825(-)